MEPKKIVIADSRWLLLTGLKSVLERTPALDLVAETHQSCDLGKLLTEHQPDVVVTGFSVQSVVESNRLKAALKKSPKTRLLYIGDSVQKATVADVMQLEPRSYILTVCDEQEIVDAIWAAVEDKAFFCGKILDVLTGTENLQIGLELADSCQPVLLSEREVEIIQLIAEEFSSKQIAEQLFISSHTVNTHRKNIMHKIGVCNTAGILMYAVRNEILSQA